VTYYRNVNEQSCGKRSKYRNLKDGHGLSVTLLFPTSTAGAVLGQSRAIPSIYEHVRVIESGDGDLPVACKRKRPLEGHVEEISARSISYFDQNRIFNTQKISCKCVKTELIRNDVFS
jgi:hypothetical protein